MRVRASRAGLWALWWIVSLVLSQSAIGHQSAAALNRGPVGPAPLVASTATNSIAPPSAIVSSTATSTASVPTVLPSTTAVSQPHATPTMPVTRSVGHPATVAAMASATATATATVASSPAVSPTANTSTDGTRHSVSQAPLIAPLDTGSCPSGWTCADIGAPTLPGDQSLIAGTWTITGAGAGGSMDAGSTSDQFHYVWQTLNGDGSLSAHYGGASSIGECTKTGLMLRQSTDPGSPYYFVYLTPCGAYSSSWTVQYRGAQGAGTTVLGGLSLGTGYHTTPYLALGRSGNTFTAYISYDNGGTWVAIPGSSATISMSSTVLAGLVSQSNNASKLNAGTLDSVSITTTALTPRPNTCPSGWNCADIGGFMLPGDQSLVTSTWTITGSGVAGGMDGGSPSDAFHYVWQPLSGDGSISARYGGAPGINECTKTGIMLRQSADPGAPYYYAYISPCDNGWTVQYRGTQGSGTTVVGSLGKGNSTTPYLGIGRVGNTFTAYISYDSGSTWAAVPGSSVTISMSSSVLAGVAVQSNNVSKLETASFDSLTFTTTPLAPWTNLCPNGWSCADIGGFMLPGSQSQLSGTLTITGAGNQQSLDPGSRSDQFHYLWQSLSGDGSLRAQVTSEQGIGECSKAGLMLRQSTDPAAPYYDAYFTPCGNQWVVQYRGTPGGTTSNWITAAGALPAYVQVVRSGNTFTAYTSSDGVTWTAIPNSSVAISMTPAILAGLMVMSNNASKLDTATINGSTLQPTSGSGTTPWHPHHSVRLSDGLSASIDLADGHLDLSQADVSIPGRGGSDLTLSHTWDSVLAQAGVTSTAGAGWLDSLTPSMGGLLTGTVAFTDATGAVWSYPYTGSLTATAPYTQYSPPPGDPWQLTTASAGYTLTNPLNGETLTFDAQGRYLADTDSYGNAASATYSSSVPIAWTAAGGWSGPNGRALSLAYNGSGLLSDVQSPLWRKSGGSQGRHVTYGYNASGQLTTLTRGAGSTDALTSTFGYSGTQLVTVTTPAGRSWLLGYDSQGRVSSLTSPISGTNPQQIGYTPAYTTTFAYTPGQTQLVVGAGTTGALTTTYTLDASGEATAIADGLTDTRHLTYDQDHDVLTSQDQDGNTTQNYYQYVGPSNNIGLITETLSPPVGIDYPWALPNQWATTYRYDPTTYDLLETDQPGGGITRHAYDGHHSVITSTVLLDLTTCRGQDARRAGATATRSGGGIVPDLPCQASYTWRATVNRYDAYGELVSTVDGRGLDTTNDFTGTVSLDPSSAISYTTNYTYTANGDLASVTTPPLVTLQNGTPTTGPVTTAYGYGTDGDLTIETSPNGAATATSYNHLGQVTKVTQPAVPLWSGGNTSPVETTSYDPDGNVVKQVDAAGDVSVSSYDPLGRLIAGTNPVSGTTVYTYSATEQTATQDPQGAVTQSSYDAAGRLSQTTDPSGALTQYGDDAAGNITSITSMDSASTLLSLDTRQYDALNRVITDTVSGPGLTPQVTLTSYDPDGNVAQVQQPNGDVVFDTYTKADQRETEEVDAAAVTTTTAPIVASYSYDVVGNPIGVEDFDGRVTTSQYDAANRLSQSVAYLGTSTITTTPQYDPDGNTVSQTTQTQVGSGPVQTHTVTSSVNALDWTMSSSDDGLVTTYGYDAAGQERTAAVLNGTQPVTTTLDSEGRASSIADGLSGTVAYSYNADDLPLTVTLPGGLLEQPRYDAASRLTTLTLSGPPTATQSLSSTYGYGYSPLNWTTGVTSTLNGITTTQVLTHDADGRLTGWSSGGSTQSWQYDGNGNLTLALSNSVPTTYTYGNGVPNELSKLQTPGQFTRKYAYDQQGDTTAITTTGSYSAALTYDSQARLVGVTFKSGQVVTMTYNAQGQRASYAVTQPGQPAWSGQFQYRGDQLGQAVVISGSRQRVIPARSACDRSPDTNAIAGGGH